MKLITNGVCLALYCAAALSVSGSSVFTALHEFSVFPQGALPSSPLIQGRDGTFYGVTENGGTNGGFGTIFRITTNGVVTTLYAFNDNVHSFGSITPSVGILPLDGFSPESTAQLLPVARTSPAPCSVLPIVSAACMTVSVATFVPPRSSQSP